VVLNSDDPEGTHQMRIGLRRLRSALKIFRPVLDNSALREVNEKARDLARLLGELRDADVLASDIVGQAAANHDEDAGLRALNAALAQMRSNLRAKVRTELMGRQWSCFKLKLAMLPETIEQLAGSSEGKMLSKPVRPVAGKALKKWWRKVLKTGRRLDKLSAAERHEMRKEVKTLRYAIDLLAPLYRAKDVERFAKRLRELQDVFGYVNDVAVAENLRLVRPEAMAGDLDLQRAVGYVIGWHTARAEPAWKNARSVWKRSAKSSPCWA
jgi:CHAD domain-containing protein